MSYGKMNGKELRIVREDEAPNKWGGFTDVSLACTEALRRRGLIGDRHSANMGWYRQHGGRFKKGAGQ